MQPTKTRADLWMDLLLVGFLIGFDVAARLLPPRPAQNSVVSARYSPAGCYESQRSLQLYRSPP